MPDTARVIYNRLAQGTPLQMDSTVLYALGQDGGPVTSQDLKIQSPYNSLPQHRPDADAHLHAVGDRAQGGRASPGRRLAVLRAGARRTAPWPSPTPTPSSWPTSSWPRAVASPEPGAGPVVTIDGRGPTPGPGPAWSGSSAARSPIRCRPCCTTPPSPRSGWTAPGTRWPSRWRRARRRRALDAMRRADISGLSVTMPHKADVAALVDECTDVARRLDAVNCIVNRDGVLLGHQHRRRGLRGLAGPGRGLHAGGQALPGDRRRRSGPGRGAGPGRGRGQRGRRPQPDARAGRRRPPPWPARRARSCCRRSEDAQVEAVQSADLVVNATPFGMAGASTGGAAPGWWRRSCCTPARSPPTWSTPPDRPRGWRRPPRRAPTASTGSACWSTRRRRSWCCGRVQPAPVEAMWQAAEAADPADVAAMPGDLSRSGVGAVAQRVWPAARSLGRPEPGLGQRLQRRLAQRPGQRVALRRDGEQHHPHGDGRRVGRLQARPRSAARCSGRRRRGSSPPRAPRRR